MIARSHSVGEPRWSPSGNWVGWLDSWDSRTDLLLTPRDATQPPTVVTADFPVTSAGAYGGGGWCWLTEDLVVVAGADGRLAVLRADGGGVVSVLSTGGSTFAPVACADGSRVAFCWEQDDACDVMVMAADGSGSAICLSSADYAWDPAWSPDGATVVWHEWDLAEMSWQSSRIAYAPASGLGPVVVIDGAAVGESGGSSRVAVGQPRFSPDGVSLAWVSDRGGWWNVWVSGVDGSGARPLRIEANDHAAPSWGPGQRTFSWSPDSESIAFERNENGYGRLVVASLDGTQTADVGKAFHSGLDWRGSMLLATRSGAKTPQQIVTYDFSNGYSSDTRRTLARGAVAGFEACALVEPEMVSWDSGADGSRDGSRVGDRDGVTAYGLLRRPVAAKSEESQTLPPLMVFVHGGPTDQAVAEWNPRVAYWVSRGWAVLQVNYRGSTGYGRAYRSALEGEWGIADVDDVASGIRHAGASGWCDPDRVVVTGGSAGGFTALLVCALHSNLVCAGVSLFGVGDLADLAATTHRFESKYLDGLVGELPLYADRYRDRSPIAHANKVTVPMLMLQGRDDKVVPLAQSDQMVAAMRAAGADVEYQIYDGEGHGFRKLSNVLDEYARTEAFLDRVVFGIGKGS